MKRNREPTCLKNKTSKRMKKWTMGKRNKGQEQTGKSSKKRTHWSLRLRTSRNRRRGICWKRHMEVLSKSISSTENTSMSFSQFWSILELHKEAIITPTSRVLRMENGTTSMTALWLRLKKRMLKIRFRRCLVAKFNLPICCNIEGMILLWQRSEKALKR